LWNVDPLLDNDRETSSYTAAIAKQRPRKQACFHGNERTAIMGEKFPTRPVPRWYNQDQLALAVRELLGFGHCKLVLLEVGS
jgi:hypothetical protein